MCIYAYFSTESLIYIKNIIENLQNKIKGFKSNLDTNNTSKKQPFYIIFSGTNSKQSNKIISKYNKKTPYIYKTIGDIHITSTGKVLLNIHYDNHSRDKIYVLLDKNKHQNHHIMLGICDEKNKTYECEKNIELIMCKFGTGH